MRAALLLALLASPAASPVWAACQGDEAFSCQIGAKRVEVCYWKGMLTYRFGPEGRPELTLTEPLETADFTPWPGIGRYYWQTLAFRNDGYTYEIWTSVERGPDATTGIEAAVTVLQGETEVARLDCNPGTAATTLDSISTLKDAIGQCWAYETRTWGPCN
jgi:hypothetical protein